MRCALTKGQLEGCQKVLKFEKTDKEIIKAIRQVTYLFFMSRTSLLRVTSSVPPDVPRAGEVAMTTPGVMALVGAVRIW